MPFLALDAEKMKVSITLNKVKKDDIKKYSLRIKLTDARDASSNYVLFVELLNTTHAEVEQKNITTFVAPVQEEDKSLNVSAFIKSLSVMGDLEIEFNSTMFTFFNFTELDSSVVDIYVVPAEDRWDYPGFNMSSLNLTWSLESYQTSTMKIKIKFNDPYSLSPLVK